ncbi:MAG: thiolase family protein, partial [Bacteroidia bacterium]
MKEVYIVSAVRTALGSFGGTLAGTSATQLGATAIKGALDRIKLDPKLVNEVFMGSVMQANLGQAPARQAAKFAGLPDSVNCTTVNKVCASGMKSISLAAQSIMLGDNDIVVAGGMENMSRAPYYLENARSGYRLWDGKLVDGMVHDGLWDVVSD